MERSRCRFSSGDQCVRMAGSSRRAAQAVSAAATASRSGYTSVPGGSRLLARDALAGESTSQGCAPAAAAAWRSRRLSPTHRHVGMSTLKRSAICWKHARLGLAAVAGGIGRVRTEEDAVEPPARLGEALIIIFR